jgi:hypothetical protein
VVKKMWAIDGWPKSSGFCFGESIPMKHEGLSAEEKFSPMLLKLGSGLERCVQQFEDAYASSLDEWALGVAFANGIFLGIADETFAAELAEEFAVIGCSHHAELLSKFKHGYVCSGNWLHGAGRILAATWCAENSNHSVGAAGRRDGQLLEALHAGLIVARELPDVAEKIAGKYPDLRTETRFFVSRVSAWCESGWAPPAQPFVEYTESFYESSPAEGRVVAVAIAKVLPVALALAEPWEITLWSNTGWHAGREFAETDSAVVMLGTSPGRVCVQSSSCIAGSCWAQRHEAVKLSRYGQPWRTSPRSTMACTRGSFV